MLFITLGWKKKDEGGLFSQACESAKSTSVVARAHASGLTRAYTRRCLAMRRDRRGRAPRFHPPPPPLLLSLQMILALARGRAKRSRLSVSDAPATRAAVRVFLPVSLFPFLSRFFFCRSLPSLFFIVYALRKFTCARRRDGCRVERPWEREIEDLSVTGFRFYTLSGFLLHWEFIDDCRLLCLRNL